MKKAFKHVLLYYLIAGVLSLLAYIFIPHAYVHAPGVHHLLIGLMFVTSLFWGVIALILWLRERENMKLKFYYIFNLIPSGIFFIWFVISIYRN
ncbi:hypothetical protein AAON49_10850 [Pseudotenacibaculum sp. MALMAid0570]|uniref:hypothetical protein n=1 Tax=Pseudotenacibaculum sp. MALMAid0570 TaxID=3143938 RepID=UPI0032DFCB0F